jgi:hypothetical protein
VYEKAHMIHILSPVDPGEAKRIRNTLGKASRQLPYKGNNIVCLELPHFAFVFPEQIILTALMGEFNQSRSTRIGAILLNKRTMSNVAGTVRHCDNLYLLRNPNAEHHISDRIMDYINPSSWMEILPQREAVPFYEYAVMPFFAKFRQPDIRYTHKGVA